MGHKILVVDDDQTTRRMIAAILQSHLHLSVLEAENGQQAIENLSANEEVKVIISDLEMPVMDGHALIKTIARNYKSLPVIVLTATQKMEDAVLAMKEGATDFLSKPLEKERLIVSVRNALKLSLMSNEISKLRKTASNPMMFDDLVGAGSGLSKTVSMSRKASQNDFSVLITGETGTGKEMLARAIHGESQRRDKPFIAVNCGALPEKLIESTLFGHEKGAFTGAIDKATGKFQEADTGTLFLDEIGELPLDAQVKLLRALQQKEIEPVGAGKALKVDVRIISATNRDLLKEVKEGRFREDLYFRLNVLNIDVPPLRNRLFDIDLLIQHFAKSFFETHAIAVKPFCETALKKLKSHDWPGNIRELENVVNRALVLSEKDQIEDDDIILGEQEFRKLPENIIHVLDHKGAFRNFKDLENEIIKKAVNHHKNNMTKTAKVLGFAKSTLYAKLNEELQNEQVG